jgi:cytosine/adenosine deaminase-related metal-dependent hydrolase
MTLAELEQDMNDKYDEYRAAGVACMSDGPSSVGASTRAALNLNYEAAMRAYHIAKAKYHAAGGADPK